MASRLLNLAAAIWVLHIAPTLCLAGVLTHPCVPAAERVCESTHCDEADHVAESSKAGSCSHESNCDFDPCQTPVIRAGGEMTVVELGPLVCTMIVRADDAPMQAQALLVQPSDPPDIPALPLFASALPLLI